MILWKGLGLDVTVLRLFFIWFRRIPKLSSDGKSEKGGRR
jgi:hypothetical protein